MGFLKPYFALDTSYLSCGSSGVTQVFQQGLWNYLFLVNDRRYLRYNIQQNLRLLTLPKPNLRLCLPKESFGWSKNIQIHRHLKNGKSEVRLEILCLSLGIYHKSQECWDREILWDIYLPLISSHPISVLHTGTLPTSSIKLKVTLFINRALAKRKYIEDYFW